MSNDKEIREHLDQRWEYLGQKGWQGKITKDQFIARNMPHVRRNLEDNPDYLREQRIRYNLRRKHV